MTNILVRAAIAVLPLVIGLDTARAAELQTRTGQAYDAYVKQVTQAFLARTKTDRIDAKADKIEASRNDSISIRPGREDGIIEVPGGLVHHWIGSVYIPGVDLKRAVDVSSSYSEYSHVYHTVVKSTVLRRYGDSYGVLVRLKEREGGFSAVLDIKSTIQYSFPTERTVYAISNAEQIREVKNAGEAGEQLMPPGRDSGYLWRANTFTLFRSDGRGVYVESETVALSRSFPPMLGWVIEPIALRVGRRSVERSLSEFVAAVCGTVVARAEGT